MDKEGIYRQARDLAEGFDLKGYVSQVFENKFPGSILGIEMEQYPHEYDIIVIVGEKTDEMRDFSFELESYLSEQGIPSLVIVKEKNKSWAKRS